MNVSVARTIAAAYPPPVRRRWGSALTTEIAHRGASGWLDALAGAARLWLRPGQWPVPSGSHTRRAVVVLAMLTAGAAAVGARGLPTAAITAGSGLAVVALILITAGLVVLVPLPKLTRASLRSVTRAVAAPLAPVGVLLVAVLLLAHSGVRLHGVSHSLAVVLYWTTVASLALAPAAAVFRIDPEHAAIPGRRRATLGLMLLCVGLALTGLIALSRRSELGGFVYGVMQLGLAAVTGACIVDLRHSHLAC